MCAEHQNDILGAALKLLRTPNTSLLDNIVTGDVLLLNVLILTLIPSCQLTAYIRYELTVVPHSGHSKVECTRALLRHL